MRGCRCHRMSSTTSTFPDGKAANCDSKPVNFEEAILLTGYGRFHLLAVFCAGCCLLSVICEMLDIGYVIPSAQCYLQLSTQEKGLLNAMVFIGMMSSSHMWGFLADTRGRKRILMLSLLLNSTCSFISSFSHAFWLLVIFRFFSGFFICGSSAVVYAYLGEFNSEQNRDRAIVLASTFISFGMTGVPAMAWVVIPQTWSFELPWCSYTSWRMLIAILSLPGFLTALLVALCLPESPKFLLAQGRDQEALQVLRGMYVTNTGNRPDQYPVSALLRDPREGNHRVADNKSLKDIMASMWDQTWPLFKPPYLLNTFLACSMQFGIFASANGLMLWFPEWFNLLSEYSTLHPDQQRTMCEVFMEPTNTTAAFAASANGSADLIVCTEHVDASVFTNSLIIGASCGLTFLGAGFLVNYLGKKTIIFASLLMSGAAGIGLNYVSDSILIMVLACIFTSLSGTCVSIVNTIVVEVYPTHHRAMAVSLSMMMGRLGTVLASILVGVLIQVQCSFVFLLFGACLIVCGFTVLMMTNPSKANLIQ